MKRGTTKRDKLFAGETSLDGSESAPGMPGVIFLGRSFAPSCSVAVFLFFLYSLYSSPFTSSWHMA